MKKSHFKQLEIRPHQEGLCLIDVLKVELFSDYSKKCIKRALDARACFINDLPEKYASYRVRKGDKVKFYTEFLQNFSKSWPILFEDETIIVFDKPAGSICHNPMLVHRLDKDTSGVIICAKTQKAKLDLEQQFYKRKVSKTYVALVHGHIDEQRGAIKGHLKIKTASTGQKTWMSTNDKQGLFAETRWEKVQSNEEASLVYVYPKTGRMHQIRVHLSDIGHPVVGDLQYGIRAALKGMCITRHLLHAYSITFFHPYNKQKQTISSQLPKDFQQAIQCVFSSSKCPL